VTSLKARFAMVLLACGGKLDEPVAAAPSCATSGPYQSACTTEGATCQTSTACADVPFETYLCHFGEWLYPKGTPECAAGDAGVECICADEMPDSACPVGESFCYAIDPPDGCPNDRGCCHDPATAYALHCVP
jgi:hypothetical protein